MPISYKIDKKSGTVLYRAAGRVADQDMIALSRAAGRDPEYVGGLNGLVDARGEAFELDISAIGLRNLADFNRDFPRDLNHARMAIVANSDLAYGLSRMMQAYAEDLSPDYSVFRDMAEACRWLGIPPTVCDENDGWIEVG